MSNFILRPEKFDKLPDHVKDYITSMSSVQLSQVQAAFSK
jgi:hypothetical protein